MNVCKFA